MPSTRLQNFLTIFSFALVVRQFIVYTIVTLAFFLWLLGIDLWRPGSFVFIAHFFFAPAARQILFIIWDLYWKNTFTFLHFYANHPLPLWPLYFKKKTLKHFVKKKGSFLGFLRQIRGFFKSPPTPPPPVSMRQLISLFYFATNPNYSNIQYV